MAAAHVAVNANLPAADLWVLTEQFFGVAHVLSGQQFHVVNNAQRRNRSEFVHCLERRLLLHAARDGEKDSREAMRFSQLEKQALSEAALEDMGIRPGNLPLGPRTVVGRMFSRTLSNIRRQLCRAR